MKMLATLKNNFREWWYDLDPFYYPRQIRYWLALRLWNRRHVINTGLEPGRWHESDDLILHGMFAVLVDFVVNELSYAHLLGGRKEFKKWQLWFWYNMPWTFRPDRRLDYAMEYLEDSQEERPVPDDSTFGPIFSENDRMWQEAYREMRELFVWWTVERPSRPDPYETTGWFALCAAERDKGLTIFEKLNDIGLTPEEKQIKRDTANRIHDIEEDYRADDDFMLNRLVKVRHAMWT